MAGHMGNKNCTKFAVRVSISVDVFNNYGSGSVGAASCIAFYDNGQSLPKRMLIIFGRRAGEREQSIAKLFTPLYSWECKPRPQTFHLITMNESS